MMPRGEMRQRTKQFALRIVRMYCSLPRNGCTRVLGTQALRSGTSVAANYREASRARSDAELISKLGIVEQELDETLLWLELLVEAGVVPEAKMSSLHDECEELLRMIVAGIKTMKSRTRQAHPNEGCSE